MFKIKLYTLLANLQFGWHLKNQLNIYIHIYIFLKLESCHRRQQIGVDVGVIYWCIYASNVDLSQTWLPVHQNPSTRSRIGLYNGSRTGDQQSQSIKAFEFFCFYYYLKLTIWRLMIVIYRSLNLLKFTHFFK